MLNATLRCLSKFQFNSWQTWMITMLTNFMWWGHFPTICYGIILMTHHDHMLLLSGLPRCITCRCCQFFFQGTFSIGKNYWRHMAYILQLALCIQYVHSYALASNVIVSVTRKSYSCTYGEVKSSKSLPFSDAQNSAIVIKWVTLISVMIYSTGTSLY